MYERQMMSMGDALRSSGLLKKIEEMEAGLKEKRASQPPKPRVLPVAPSSPRFLTGFHPSQLVFEEDWKLGRVVARLAPELENCPVCFNSGNEVFREGPYQYSRPCQTCGPARTIIERFERVKLAPEWAHITEDGTNWRPDLKALYQNFLQNWRPHNSGLFLYGDTGRGKTHLAALMAFAFAFQNIRVEWRRWGLFLEELRESYGDTSYTRERESRIRERIVEPQVLFIDDFGEGRKTQWTEEIFERIIGYRLERRLTTIITSNVKLEELREYAGHRAYSRIMRVCIPIEIQGEDYRLRGVA